MTALMTHYISTKQHYYHLQTSLDEAMALQLASDLLRDSIRQAGFTPCLSINQLITLNHLDGQENVKALDVSIGLRINRMSPHFNVVLAVSSPTQLLTTRDSPLHTTQLVLVSDCYHAEVLRVRDVHLTSSGQVVTLSHPLAFTYQTSAYIGEWLQERFFVRPQGGLFYHRKHTDELTPFVKTMSVTLHHRLASVNLGLDAGRSLTLDTKVRAQ